LDTDLLEVLILRRFAHYHKRQLTLNPHPVFHGDGLSGVHPHRCLPATTFYRGAGCTLCFRTTRRAPANAALSLFVVSRAVAYFHVSFHVRTFWQPGTALLPHPTTAFLVCTVNLSRHASTTPAPLHYNWHFSSPAPPFPSAPHFHGCMGFIHQSPLWRWTSCSMAGS